MEIIGISGFISSGKSSMGQYLVDHHGFTRLSFADALKDATAAIFGWPRKALNGLTPRDRVWRETEDAYWTKAFGRSVTPRWALQFVGTDVCRNHLHPNIWVDRVGMTLHSAPADAKFVFDDVRFANEIDCLEKFHATMITLLRPSVMEQRPDLQILWDYYVHGKQGFVLSATEITRNLHPSEWAWLEAKYVNKNTGDILINNHDTLAGWEEHIENWYTKEKN